MSPETNGTNTLKQQIKMVNSKLLQIKKEPLQPASISKSKMLGNPYQSLKNTK